MTVSDVREGHFAAMTFMDSSVRLSHSRTSSTFRAGQFAAIMALILDRFVLEINNTDSLEPLLLFLAQTQT